MSDTKQLCELCQKERRQFAQDNNPHSPGCAALWRMAIAKNEEAWGCLQTTLGGWLNQLCKAALNRAAPHLGLSHADPADLVQDVWHNLWRYMVRNPADAIQLVEQNEIGRVIGLIKTTAKRRVIELGRKATAGSRPLLEDRPNSEEQPEETWGEVGKVEPHKPELMLDLLAFLQKHIQTVKERIVAEVIFLQEMKPQDVLDLYPAHFQNIDEVNQTRQTLVRRMRADPARQNFLRFASLPNRVDQKEVRMDGSDPCPYNEGILLDYLNGHLDVQTQRAIERSPACIAAANALQADVVAWQPGLRQMFCPSSERLVDYQERHISGTEYLVIHNHVQHCSWCRAEIEMLAAVDEVGEVAKPSLARRIYELIFQPATMAPVPMRGEGSYRTIERSPQIELLIRTSRIPGRQGTWMLFGRLRYEGDQPVTQVDSIVMQDIEDQNMPEYLAKVDDKGTFTIRNLEEGSYRMRINRENEEIVLRQIKIGDD